MQKGKTPLRPYFSDIFVTKVKMSQVECPWQISTSPIRYSPRSRYGRGSSAYDAQ